LTIDYTLEKEIAWEIFVENHLKIDILLKSCTFWDITPCSTLKKFEELYLLGYNAM
jgi:hypothetical protein